MPYKNMADQVAANRRYRARKRERLAKTEKQLRDTTAYLTKKLVEEKQSE